MKSSIKLFLFFIVNLLLLTEAYSQSKNEFGFTVGLGASGWNQAFTENQFEDYYIDFLLYDGINLNYSFGSTYAIGVYWKRALNKHLDCSIELNFKENGYQFTYQYGSDFTKIIENRIGQIQIPLSLHLNLTKKNRSPYLKFGLSSNIAVRNHMETTTYTTQEEAFSWAGSDYWSAIQLDEKQLSFQAIGGFGVNLGKRISLETTVLWGKDFAKTPPLICYCYYYIEPGQVIKHNRSFMINFYYSLSDLL